MTLQAVGERRHLVDEIHAELRHLAPLQAVAARCTGKYTRSPVSRHRTRLVRTGVTWKQVTRMTGIEGRHTSLNT